MNTDICNSDKKSSIEECIGILLKKNNLTLSTAESCTGGGIASRITSIPGSSEYFKGGIVAYSNEVKRQFLKVKDETLEKYGAVSEETILEMVKGSMNAFNTDCAIATSGIAGPDGGSSKKPVGTIWIAVALGEKIRSYRQEGDAGRKSNTERAITNALLLLQSMLDEGNASHSQIINKLLV